MITDKRLGKGTLAATNGTLYTVPASTKTIVKSVMLCNTGAAAATLALKLAGVEIFAGHSLVANSSLTIQNLDQILEAGELIEGSASAADTVRYYLSGKEIT